MAATGKRKKNDLFHYLKFAAMVLFFVFLVIICILGYRFGVDIFTNEGVTDEAHAVQYTLKVEAGESVYNIGKDLETHGIIRSRLVFLVQSKLYKCKIPPGVFSVNSGMSSKAILKYLNDEYLKAKEAASKEK